MRNADFGMRNETAPGDLRERTKRFALPVIRLVASLDRRVASQVIGRQLLRCATSVGANYRAACRARSRAEFIAKLGIVEEEADETLYWMELLVEAKLVDHTRIEHLMDEGNEILSIIVASIRTARKHSRG
jgi:four helix bundle protein